MRWFAIWMVAGFAMPSHAQETIAPRTSAQVLAPVEQYARAIGCNLQLDRRNVAQYRLDDSVAFVVVYSLDVGCTGGSAMTRSVFAVVRRGGNDHFFIDPRYSSPFQTDQGFPPLIERITVEGRAIRYTGRELDPAKDAPCCPSVLVEGLASFDKGKWISVGTPVMPSNPSLQRDAPKSARP